LIKQLSPIYIDKNGEELQKWNDDNIFVAAVEYVCGFNAENRVVDVTIDNVAMILKSMIFNQ